MVGDGKTPGDGKTSPFGDGKGGSSMTRAGSNDFAKNPNGTRGGGAKPRNFVGPGVSRDQEKFKDEDLSQAEIPPGGKDLSADAKEDKGNPIGTTAAGATRTPFKLDGGG